MEKEENEPRIQKSGGEIEDAEPIELVLFQVPECYVYIVSLPFRRFLSKVDFGQWVLRGVWFQFTTQWDVQMIKFHVSVLITNLNLFCNHDGTERCF